ncbi:hypothetical protein GHK92_04430 [Nocardioides sp. dk4132]|uniref:hypothetical protein n=1 Tax=unclassified Nocardioides TaxID=2615069 RepID=UPI0012978EB3|nr:MULTISPECIES: hypothetical protein [unclassified Nocardioides]MQW75111.1 hypothetical protein [Nocardioides sp. dk4132]QGA07723.1 hypothetical protein GFH29_10180 [Nocardioides sp. dk884]
MPLLPPPHARANRLTYDDDLFLRSRRVLGVPLVNQTVWRFPEPLDVARLEALHRRLATGRLARVAVAPQVPGARPHWVRSAVSAPLVVDTAPVALDGVLAWADDAARLPLDPVAGPTWALRAAPSADRGSVLSYLTSHVVADGGAHLAALSAAVRGTEEPCLPVDDVDRFAVRRRDDARDAAHQLRRTARGAAIAWRRARTPRPPVEGQVSADTPPRHPAAGDDTAYDVATAVVDCSAQDWERAAAAAGGTSNSLLVAVGVEVLLGLGRAEAGRPVRVAVPVNLRTGDADLRANATAGVSIAVATQLVGGVGRVAGLEQVRAATRRELRARSEGTRHDPLEPWQPLLQMVPDRAVARLARDQSAPLCLCSNLGELEGDYRAPLGVEPTSVAMRSVTPGATRGRMRRTRGGVSAWWSRHGARATLSLVCLDPELPAERLTPLLVAACERWGVPATAW